ncbi:hypothetical protein LCGC14_0679710 [marine sediment metagenome]|uniref:Uncharacterized protein n=1 Tax=marine sediment metagenome TaxID=412755 RepID=A0A0F9TWH6_9ZZZZ
MSYITYEVTHTAEKQCECGNKIVVAYEKGSPGNHEAFSMVEATGYLPRVSRNRFPCWIYCMECKRRHGLSTFTIEAD